MAGTNALPPGQHELKGFPRFGLAQFANRFPKETGRIELKISGDVGESVTPEDELRDLRRGK